MEASQRNILREVEVWSSVNHPSIVNLVEFFVDATTVRPPASVTHPLNPPFTPQIEGKMQLPLRGLDDCARARSDTCDLGTLLRLWRRGTICESRTYVDE